MRSKFYQIFLFLLTFVFLTNAQEPSQIQSKNPLNLIHYGDIIDVDVLGSTEFDWRGTLDPEGFLDGIEFTDEQIYGLCQSEESIAAIVAKSYSKFLRNPKVLVKILDRSGRAVSYLYGAVKTPQRFLIERSVQLNELLILAGGIDEKASGEINILRANSLNCEGNEETVGETENILINQKKTESQVFKINISDLIKGEKNANPLILNGDIITVIEAEQIYVIGGVASPRKINFRSQTTISRAIASAGGFAKNGDPQNIVIYRRTKNERQRIVVDYEKIKANQSEDFVLQKFDIVEVGEKGKVSSKFVPIVKVLDNQSKSFELPLRIIE